MELRFAVVGKEGSLLMAETSHFPSGMSEVDLLWHYFDQSYDMELTAGFVGFRQDPVTLSLRPVISWAVVEKMGRPGQEEELAKDSSVRVFLANYMP